VNGTNLYERWREGDEGEGKKRLPSRGQLIFRRRTK